MAIYDRNEDRIIVRVIYDGFGNAGKTTNLRELCNFFTLRRRSELYVPEERDGRTLYFDWLQIESGLVGGHRLRCQVMSVPGQLVLRERRARLLRTADVVVLVCDSTREGVERASKGFARTRGFVADQVGSDVTFIVQANKQDLPNALSTEEIARILGGGESLKVVAARAHEGVGVRETVVLAIRAAADRVQQILLDGGIESIEGAGQSPEHLYQEMREAELGSADSLSLDALLDDERAPSAPSSIPAPATEHVKSVAPIASVAPVASPASMFKVAAAPLVESMVPAPTSLVPTFFAESVAPPPSLAPAAHPSVVPVSETMQLIEAVVTGTLAWPTPPVDVRMVPSGLVWPSATGRDALRAFEHRSPRPIYDRIAQSGASDGSGKSGFVLYEVDGTCFKTNQTRVYSTLEDARDALVALVRTKIQIGGLAPKGTVLAAYQEGQAYRLWTIAPWHSTLSSRLLSARTQRDEQALGGALVDFAEAVVDALVLRARQELLLDVHPSNFAREDGQTIYLDDEVTRGGGVYAVVHAVLQRIEEHVDYSAAIERYLSALEAAMSRRLVPADIQGLELLQQLLEIQPRAPVAEAARLRLASFVRAFLRPQERPSSIPAPLHRQPFAMVASVVPVPLHSDRPTARPSRAPTPTFQVSERTSEYVIVDQAPVEALAEPQAESRPELMLLAPAEFEEIQGFDPPLPCNADALPSGYIWPAATGRELVRQMAATAAVPAGQHAASARVYRVGDYRLTTSLAERFDDPDEGRAELLKRARAQVLSVGLAAATVVLVLVPSTSDGSHWLWTIEPATTRPSA